MKIILYKDILNLGEEGDVKEVANGYARNYLIPRKLAVRYSLATQNELSQKQKAIDLRRVEKARAATDAKAQVESLRMEVALAAGKEGRLFGSITNHAVSDYLHSQGISVERKKIELPEGGIKVVGEYSVKVKLYGGEDASLKIAVSALGEEETGTESTSSTKTDEKNTKESTEENSNETPLQDNPSDTIEASSDENHENIPSEEEDSSIENDKDSQ